VLVGASPSGRVTIYVDKALGQAGMQNAKDLLLDADRVVQANDHFFGTSSGSVNVIIYALDGKTDGTGGADHMGCDYVVGNNIEVCASFGNSARVSGLFEAELSECNMNGNLCGVSTGEALSRWCAATVCNNALSDFATAPAWFNDGALDFVTHTDPTAGNPVFAASERTFRPDSTADAATSGSVLTSSIGLPNIRPPKSSLRLRDFRRRHVGINGGP
jgi:hypothetical protein